MSKLNSSEILAKELDCNINDIRKTFFRSLKDEKYSSYQIHCFISQFENDKDEESKKYGLDKEDSPASILKLLTQEYINLSKDDYYMTTAKFLSEQGKTIEETQRIISAQIEDFPNKNKILRDILFRDNPIELLRLKAIDYIYEENNYHGALILINKALLLDNDNLTLNQLKVEVLEKLKETENNS